MSAETKKEEKLDVDTAGLDILDEDTEMQAALTEEALRKLKEEEERRKKYANMTMQDIAEAIDKLEYFITESERAKETLKKLRPEAEAETDPEKLFAKQIMKGMHLH